MRDSSASADSPTETSALAYAEVRSAAAIVLRPRFRVAIRRIDAAIAKGDTSIAGVHKLRVATRRAAAALQTLAPVLPEKKARSVRRCLRRLRRSAGAARDADVLIAMLSRVLPRAEAEESLGVRHVMDLAEKRAASARKALRAQVRQGGRDDLRRAARRLLSSLEGRGVGRSFAPFAAERLAEAAREFTAACDEDLRDFERLHALRLVAKRLRYTIEVLSPVLADVEPTLDALARLQDSLGGANDSHEALARVNEALTDLPQDADLALRTGLEALSLRFESQRDDRSAAAVERLAELRPVLMERMQQLAPRAPEPAPPTRRATPHNGAARPDVPPTSIDHQRGAVEPPAPWRVAAIDVGTNTVRLIIAEAYSDGNYRILDDEKETSRLGRGLASTGALAPDAIDAAATTIAHMRRIAEGYLASRIRIVATAAVRDASNRAEFLSLVRQRAGLPVDVISAEHEARLAFLSASRAFDLRSLPAAVADVGGGSTEIVLSAQGVIEEIAAIPFGAVRLTEQFGGPEAVAGDRHHELRRHIRRTLRDRLPRSAHEPQLLIGSGGTFEAIAKIAMCEERGVASVSAGARGYDLTREDVKRILKRLRRMTESERRAVPGLSSQRADIIVAGAAIVLEVLKRLRVDRLRVNDGGIRDGIIRSMIGEHFAPVHAEDAGRARANAVRDFASSCRYDRRHCSHVAELALSLFDQLANHVAAPLRPWISEESRTLLEAAAILHDCGYHINYARHHLHSHHLIIHSDMPGFSRRELEIVAAVARYHRGSPPKPRHEAMAVLSREDRGLVMALSAILRIADGLDRTHTQRVRAVRLEHVPDDAMPWIVHVHADSDPVVDIWGAERKSNVFESFFGSVPRIVWSCDADQSAAPPAHPGVRAAN